MRKLHFRRLPNRRTPDMGLRTARYPDKIITEKRSCTLQWKPAHVHILGNEKADELAKPRACPQSSNLTTLIDANAVASRRLISNNLKYFIPALNSNRTITSITIILRTKHVKGMKISTDGQKRYTNHCPNCSNVQLSPQHVLNCPAIKASVFKIGPEDPENLIFSDKAVEVAEGDEDSFGRI
ncbi:RNase H domain-containing protein [Trichonephila clavipes]|nr:RNase H domain-containing protein [Trichonephila clavipes]